MSYSHESSVLPLFLDDGRSLEQFGSGVLVALSDRHFVLTAAHVTDLVAQGDVCAPTEEGILPIRGGYGHARLPRNVPRNTDKYDIAYFSLSPDYAGSLHRAINPLIVDDCRLWESLVEDDIYTFTGYPASKSRARSDSHSTEMFSYTGAAASIAKYGRMGYDTADHILVNFNRKKSINNDGRQLMPPHPRGISGGGVFAWPKDVFDKTEPDFRRYLVGIAHTYEKRSNCLIGTRINKLLALIVANHPELGSCYRQVQRDDDSSIPMFVAMVWYRRDEWPLLMSDFEDADKYQKTWSLWRQALENGLEHLGRDGAFPTPVEITREEILDYCEEQGEPNISQTRSALASKKLVGMIRERGL